MAVDRKFEVLQPTLDRLSRRPLEVANAGLINPNSTSPLCLVDGELVQPDATGKWARATDAAKPSFFAIEDRGDTGVQASRKLAAIIAGGSFLANTVLFDATSLVVGSKLMFGVVSIEGQNRASLVLQTGSNVIVGYVFKLATVNGGKLQFISALT